MLVKTRQQPIYDNVFAIESVTMKPHSCCIQEVYNIDTFLQVAVCPFQGMKTEDYCNIIKGSQLPKKKFLYTSLA